MAPWVKVLAYKPDDPSLIPGIHLVNMVKEENLFMQVVFWLQQVHHGINLHAHTQNVILKWQ